MEVTLKVYRLDPSRERKPRYQIYQVPYKHGLTVLDALLYVKERLDPTLAIRYSCRMSSCGSCGMTINGVPRLACYTQVAELDAGEIRVEPLMNYAVVRDLVSDFDDFFEKHRQMRPWLMRRDEEEQENPKTQYLQTDEEILEYIQFSYCIRCGLCYAACPVVTALPEFPGPQALGQLYRYYVDSRDEAPGMRLEVANNAVGLWRCHFAGSCSAVCPKGVDPALAIQLLRREMLRPKKR